MCLAAALPLAAGGVLGSGLFGGRKKSKSSKQSVGQPYEPTTQAYGAAATPQTGRTAPVGGI